MVIPFDNRLVLFPTDALVKVQRAYNTFHMFATAFLRVLSDYEEGKIKDLKVAVQKLRAATLQENVAEAMDVTVKLLPQNA